MPDHVHLFISAPPTVAPVDIVRKLKSISANEIIKGFPKSKQSKFWGSGLWSRGYYIGTAEQYLLKQFKSIYKIKRMFNF